MASPTVTVTNLSNVLIDGVQSGAVTDVIANRPNGVTPSAVLAAVNAWHQAEVDAETAKHVPTNEALTSELADVKAAAEAREKELTTKITDLEAVLGGTEAGQALIEQRAQEARAAEKAALQAKLAEIEAAEAQP